MEKRYLIKIISARPFVRLLILNILALQMMACSLLPTGKEGTYHSAAFNDLNRAPAHLAPEETSNSKIDPLYMQTQADFHFTLGETYSLAGESQKAIEEFRLTLIYDPHSATVRGRLAREYLRLGMLSESMEQAELAVQEDAQAVEPRLLLGKLYTGLKMFDQAKEQYRKVIEIQPKNSDASLFIGAILAEQGKYDEAISHLQKLSKADGFERPELVQFYIGRVYEQKGGAKSLKAARKAYGKSLEIDPQFEESLLALVRTYLTEKNKQAAIKMMRSYQNEHGPSESVAEVLVDFYLEDEKYDLAFEQFEILEEKNPQDISVKHKMALILMEKKEYQKAISYLQKILAKEPHLDKIRFYLAAVYEELKNNEQAIAHFSKIPASSPFYGDAIVHAAYLYKTDDKVNMAIDLVQEAISKRTDIPEFYTLYASFLDETKQFEKAVAMLEQAVKSFPEDPQLQFYMGSMYDKVGKTAKTIEAMKKVLAIDQNHVQALNYLAYTYAEGGTELDTAEVLVRRALELTPDDGYIMDTLGWILFKKGRIESAVSTLEKAYRLKNTESIIAEHLGDAYYKYQLPEKAREMYIKAVEVETDNSNIKKLQKKIGAIDKQSERNPRQPASSPEAGQ